MSEGDPLSGSSSGQCTVLQLQQKPVRHSMLSPSHFFVNDNHPHSSTSLETDAPAKHHLICDISSCKNITKFPLPSLWRMERLIHTKWVSNELIALAICSQ